MKNETKNWERTGVKPYVLSIFGITVALGYGPVAREWLLSWGIGDDASSAWASIAALFVAAAGVWLIARFLPSEEKDQARKDQATTRSRRYREWLRPLFLPVPTSDLFRVHDEHARNESYYRSGILSMVEIPLEWDETEELSEETQKKLDELKALRTEGGES